MPIRLKCIEVENFKSYKGHHVIGPLKPFNAIIGPNGSGKSNFMDAISFVMGEKTLSLRVKRLSDLIHGASINKPIAKSASVTAVFFLDDETRKEISFQRTIQGSSSEYRVDGTVVSINNYLAELEKFKINVRAKNFLVFQGQVESVAMKNPKEMTSLLEEISGSAALKEEYDNLKRQMLMSGEEINSVHQKKKLLTAERKSAIQEKEEAEKYAVLQNELKEKQVEHQLFILYHNECEIKNLEMDMKRKRKELEVIEKKKEKAENALKEKKKDLGVLNRDLAKIEQDIREMEVEISKRRPQFIKSKEQVVHVQKKLDGAIKTLEQAKKAHEAHMNDIKKLEDELAEVERLKREYEEKIVIESQSQGRDIHLEAEQVREYYRLKDEAAKQSANHMLELQPIEREQKTEQDHLDNLLQMKTDNENRQKQKSHEKGEMECRLEKLVEVIRSCEEGLQMQKQIFEGLQSDINSSKDRVQNIQKQLEDVWNDLGNAQIDKHEENRSKNKQEIVENFKRNYAGVFDRLVNICHPIHKRYNVPITKVMGKYMEAIVVDTEHTARQCIQYLREQRLGIETFLPLDYLKSPPLDKKLRNIKDPEGTKLLYDVIQFPKNVEKAILFVTKNALICETPEDAQKVAYELSERHDAVSLNGTYYQKSGIISGGTLDLEKRAKRWDEKHITELKEQKEKLTTELRKAMDKSRKESEMNIVESQIRGLETRLRYAKTDMESTKKQIKVLDIELINMRDLFTSYTPQIEATEKTIRSREKKIKEINLKMNSVEDVVFSKFCQEIGIRNIREYEDRDLRVQEERNQKRLEFEKQINRITSSLEFERSRDTLSNVSRWKKVVDDETENLQIVKKQEQKHKDVMNNDLQQVEKLKAEKLSKKLEVDGKEKEVVTARKEVGLIAKDVQTAEKTVVSLENKIESRRSERHAILMQCKMDDIVIPMVVGDMDDIFTPDPQSQSSSGDSSAHHLEKEARIEIDYNTLSENLKKLKEKHRIKECADEQLQSINSLLETLSKIGTPNLKAVLKLESAQSKLQSTNDKFKDVQKQNKNVRNAFEKIKQQRYDKFTKCFEIISNKLDTIYKSLTQNESAQAFLIAENPEEPYLDGINYSCVAPGKRFQSMSNLSGGEKTIAALALLFAIHSYQKSPFFVLDEVDAALDNTNISKVAKFINDRKDSLQTIVISLKEEFYSYADNLIGVYPEPADCIVSKMLSMNLMNYGKY